MLDIKLIREKPDIVIKDLKKRQEKEKLKWLEELIEYDKKWRSSLKRLEELRRRKNIITSEIAELKKNRKPVKKQIREVKEIPEKIRKLETQNEKYKEKINHYLMQLPNILHESVPYGKDDKDNKEVRRFGKPPEFGFKPRNHMEILEDLGLIDAERAGKVAGAGFYYMKNELALLDHALMRFTIDFMMKRGYTLIEPPFMMRRRPYLGVTDLEFFGGQLYKVEGEDLYMIATSEHPMAAMYMDEVLDQDQLPIKLIGVSTNFRKEVGSHGKYTKGLFRMHQFNKVEQFIFCHPRDSWKFHEELQKNAEDLYKALGLHFRVVNVCTGDIGIIAAKKYDIEMWMADGKYREAGSNSNCTAYQARRLNIKYREGEGRPPKDYVHTLNNTAIATSRTMIALLEQNQQKDGSVKIPKALQPYMNGMIVLKKRSE